MSTAITSTTGPGNLGTTITQSGNLYDITGGTRPGNGTNLFHSFGEFGVPTNHIANFLNETPNLATSNILGRVTGGNPSNIFGTIQTTGFGNANLFLMNPTGFLFGPNATVNVGGMVAFTTADYLRLDEVGGPNAGIFHADLTQPTLLTSAPVAAFGFLGSNPAAIAVQGSQLTVANGTGLSLVGGNRGFTYTDPDTGLPASVPDGMTMTGGRLSAPGGQINLASVASPGEILAGTLDQAPTINGQSFGNLGTIHIAEKSVLDVSGDGGGTIRIRGGNFIVDDSTISANVTGPGPIINGVESIGGGIDIQVSQDAVIQNLAVLETNVIGNATPDVQYGSVHVEAEHIEIAGVLDFELFPFTGIRSNVLPGSTGGNSGDVKLEANSILVKDFALVDTLTEGAGDAGNIILRTDENLVIDNFGTIESLSLFASGNAGNIELTSAHGNILMTNFPFVTSQAFEGSGNAGNISVTAPEGDVLLADQGSLFNANRGTGTLGGIQITANNLQIIESAISGDNVTEQVPGNITVTLSGSLSLSGNSFIQTVARRSAPAGDLTITAHDVLITEHSFISTETTSSGPGGQLNIFAENLQLTNGSQIRSGSTIFSPPGQPPRIPSGAGGMITIQGLASPAESVLIDGAGSGIVTNTEGTGAGGNIFVNANTVTLQNDGTLSAKTSGTDATATGGTITVLSDRLELANAGLVTAETTGPGQAGNIFIEAREVALSGGSILNSNTSGSGQGGTVQVHATDKISIVDRSSINSNSSSLLEDAGNGGQILLRSPEIEIRNSQVSASTIGFGNAGDITAEVGHMTLTDGSVHAATQRQGQGGTIVVRGQGGEGTYAESLALSNQSQIRAETIGDGECGCEGNAGNILIKTGQLSITGASQLNTASRGSTGSAGNILIDATDSVRVSDRGSLLFSGASEFSFGNAGHITVSAPNILVANQGEISTVTGLIGNAGTIEINTNSLTLTNGGRLRSSSVLEFPEFPPTGSAGNVMIQGLASPAQSVLIDGPGSGIFTESQGSGTGGNIEIIASQSVTLTNGATVSASSTGQIENPGAAGNIEITATNGFTMQNSAITTQAGQGASGGDIKVTTAPSATVLLQNSQISASVADGPGGGGNVSIDPQYVILQNSQILAQAAQGQGGTITITANLFLPDATSIVNADSGSGLHGTVTIQSPNAPASGKIQPLGKTPLQATSLLNQHCAALAGGEFSSFTVAGRDSLPTEPGSWLTSPLTLATRSAGMGRGGKAEGGRRGVRGEDIQILSLRQIAPVGFLTQAFAADWSAGCRS